jgi:streptogramin lyase
VKYFFLITFLLPAALCSSQLPAIGLWREHLPYNSSIDVAAGDGKVFAATPYSLFTVNTADNSIQRYSKVTGLSETGISRIQYDQPHHKLIIGYNNSNVDILAGDRIYNVPDIKRDNIIGDKTIYSIYVSGDDFYLGTGLGIIVISGSRYEIKDSWFIGTGGNQVKTTGVSEDASYYYAATVEGLKRAAKSASNLADHRNWSIVSGNGLASGPIRNVLNLNGKIVIEKNDSLFVTNGNNWDLFYADAWPVLNTNVSEGKLLVCSRNSSGNAKVVILNPDGTIAQQLMNTAGISFPANAIYYNNQSWVADRYASLSRFNGSSFENYSLNSPQEIAAGQLIVHNGSFYATAGTVNSSWNYQYNGNGIYELIGGVWNNYNRFHYPVLDTVLDIITVAVDKKDGSLWAGSFGGGLLHVSAGPAFQVIKQQRIGATVGDPLSYRVSGLAFDTKGNLWISNFGAAQPLRVKKADNTWQAYSLPFPLFENAVAQVLVDDNDFKWIVAPLGNGLICFDDAGTPDNFSDDRWKRLGGPTGIGRLPGSEVFCIAKDKNGFIWVGTNDGVAVLECADQLFAPSGCDAVLPVVPQGNFAGYLLKGEDVLSIAVDGANRKWIGTHNGVFLTDPTGEKIIERFTEENSSLLSSDVKSIAIDEITGEVFFATMKGICSFRGTATEASQKDDHVLVFPNPVPPGFSGTIAIRGLTESATVKITEPGGRLVFQGRALGGQAIWDGRNYLGQRISTGVYLVLVSDDGRKEHVVTKIFFIGR